MNLLKKKKKGKKGEAKKSRSKFIKSKTQKYRAQRSSLSSNGKESHADFFLRKATNLLLSSLDYKTTFTKVVDLSLEYLADWCAVYLVSPEGNVEFYKIGYKKTGQAKFAPTLERHNAIDINAKSGVGHVIRTGKSEYYPSIKDELLKKIARSKEHFKTLKQMRITSRMIVPLRAQSKILGAIIFVSTTPGKHYSESDLLMAEDLGKRAGIAIDNAHLYHDAQIKIRELEVAEEKLKESSQKLVNMLETNSEAFFSIDKEWRYTYLNHLALKYAGKAREEMISKKMWEVFPHVVGYSFFNKYQEVMTSRKSVEFEEKMHDGWFEVRVYPYEDGICVYYRDISDRKQLEQRKDEFISIASHELKTPVTSIKLYTEIVQKLVHDEKSSEYLKHMMTQIDKLNKLVSDLLDLSRMQIGKLEFRKEKVSLERLVKEIVVMIEPTSKKHRIVYECKDPGVLVAGDRDRLGQVVTNLLTNAIKYSPQGGDIIVRVGKRDTNAIVSVQDFGVGIEELDQKKIFNRFYQVASYQGHTFPGLGIGLYISKVIADVHKGELIVKSKPGKGSLFTFILPLVKTK